MGNSIEGSVALVFPGQGAQVPGMGAELIEAGLSLSLLDVARSGGVDLPRLLVEGTAEELRPTEVAQPALYYCGVALGLWLRDQGLDPGVAAGHSLGEYCALVVAGALEAEEGMGLVLQRGRLMAGAPEGTMAAVLGLQLESLQQICRDVSADGTCCVVANDNCPGQAVISGSREGVALASDRAREAGARRVVPLNVGGAFHSPLMEEAAREFATVVDGITIREPAFPVGAGAQGQMVSSAADIRQGLREQLQSPVRWTELVRAMSMAGVTTFLECGPGNTLAALIRRTVEDVTVLPAASPAQAKAAIGLLRGGPALPGMA